MSVEDFDAGLRRGVLHWPTPTVIELVDHDPAWSAAFLRHRDALVGRPGVGEVEHIGSTAVPGLPAVAVIDLLLVVDPAGLPDLPDLVDLGWDRWFATSGLRAWRTGAVHPDRTPATVRCVAEGSDEAEHARRFRDRLRESAEDRRRYGTVKRGLAGPWPDALRYAEAKSGVIRAILTG